MGEFLNYTHFFRQRGLTMSTFSQNFKRLCIVTFFFRSAQTHKPRAFSTSHIQSSPICYQWPAASSRQSLRDEFARNAFFYRFVVCSLQAGNHQASISKLFNRLNSPIFLVAKVPWCARTVAANIKSFGPINVPFFVSSNLICA